MDPITRALAAGAAARHAGITTQALQTAYESLKASLTTKHPQAGASLQALEGRPTSHNKQASLAEDLAQTRADHDVDLLLLARRLHDDIQRVKYQPSEVRDAWLGSPAHGRLGELSAAVAVLASLLLLELILFDSTRVMDDAADAVTFCAFGGLATAALRDLENLKGWRGQAVASLPFGILATLGILHGGRPGSDGQSVGVGWGGLILQHIHVLYQGSQWPPRFVWLIAPSLGLTLFLIAFLTLTAIDDRLGLWLLAVTILGSLLYSTIIVAVAASISTKSSVRFWYLVGMLPMFLVAGPVLTLLLIKRQAEAYGGVPVTILGALVVSAIVLSIGLIAAVLNPVLVAGLLAFTAIAAVGVITLRLMTKRWPISGRDIPRGVGAYVLKLPSRNPELVEIGSRRIRHFRKAIGKLWAFTRRPHQ